MSNEQKLREALLSDMDIAVLRMPVHLAFAGNMAQFQYHNRVQALLDRIEALATPTAEQVDDINVAESFTSVTKTAAPVGELPELPLPTSIPGFYDIEARKRCVYTADQMRAYARAAIAEATGEHHD